MSSPASGDRARVTVWVALPPEQAFRHGKTGADFSREIGLWWDGLLSALRLRCEQASGPSRS